MHLETSSNLYGTTVNPFQRDLTAGGSSGGEGALLGLRGSCLGVGSDIGGSYSFRLPRSKANTAKEVAFAPQQPITVFTAFVLPPVGCPNRAV